MPKKTESPKKSRLARVYPEPIKVKKGKGNESNVTKNSDKTRSKSSMDVLVSKTPYGDFIHPNLNKLTKIKQLNADRLKFNGTVSTDRVLFKMLVSKQIHTMLHLEKFHHVLDQPKFFKALYYALKQLEGRISKLIIGGNHAIHANFVVVNVNQPVLSYAGNSTSELSPNQSPIKNYTSKNEKEANDNTLNETNGSNSKGPLNNYKRENLSPDHRNDTWNNFEGTMEMDTTNDLEYIQGTFGNSTLESTNNASMSGFIHSTTDAILSNSTTLETEEARILRTKKYNIQNESCESIAKCCLFMKEIWIRGSKMNTSGFEQFALQLESFVEKGEKPEISILGFIGTQNSEGHGSVLARIIKANIPSLKQIIFNKNVLKDSEVDAIIEALSINNNLQALNLAHNYISGDSLEKFTTFFKTQSETASKVRKWSFANIKMKEEHAQKFIDALRTNEIVTDFIITGNQDVTKRTLMTLTALLDINHETRHLKNKPETVDGLKTEKQNVINFYISQMEEQAKALYFLRSQKPPDFLELYALRLMRDLAHIEQQSIDMHHLISTHKIELSREPQVENTLIITHRVSERLYSALKDLCPRVKSDGFDSHVERYRNEILQALLRDRKLQEETEVSLAILKDQLIVLEDEAQKAKEEKEELEKIQTEITEIDKEIEMELTKKKQDQNEEELKIEVPEQDPNPLIEGDSKNYEISILSTKNAELLLIAHRNKIAKLREVQNRLTKRWKEVDIDDLMVEQELKDQVMDMRISCNAADALGLFKNLERRFLPEPEVTIEEERILWSQKEKEYQETIAKLQAALEKNN